MGWPGGKTMIFFRVALLAFPPAAVLALLLQWYFDPGFNALRPEHWRWLVAVVKEQGDVPPAMAPALWRTGFATVAAIAVATFFFQRPASRILQGAPARAAHGSAAWGRWRDVRRAGLAGRAGVTVGGWKRPFSVRRLTHDGPEHVICFAPTRSGKGAGLVLPTLLSWPDSALVLDIKGENYALSAGWRSASGQRVVRFDPAAPEGSARYNPLAEIRAGTDHEIADCQNAALMIIDPKGKGLTDFWLQGGWEWLSVVILHVIHRRRLEAGRAAALADVYAFMSLSAGGRKAGGGDRFVAMLEEMSAFEHGRVVVDEEVRRGTGRMLKRSPNERSGVHSTASVPLALYADPIVAANTAASDFRLGELMGGDRPMSLYLVIPPSDIDRLRPLLRLVVNQFLGRLTAEMAFEAGRTRPHYRHRLLLMLDEFVALGKLDIFETALGFMAGYGLKAFLIVQDLEQLRKTYGREESLMANCHVRIAYAPNRIETAKVLSEMVGRTTVIQRRRSRNRGARGGGGVTESLSETARPLLTPDECMRLAGLRQRRHGPPRPGDMLIFLAGGRPLYGRQWLYFRDRTFRRRAALAPPRPPRHALAQRYKAALRRREQLAAILAAAPVTRFTGPAPEAEDFNCNGGN